MRRVILFLLAAAACLLAGCGESGPGSPGGRGAGATTQPAVVLRAELAAALDARVWLTADAVRTTLIDGPGKPTTLAAQQALATGSRALAQRLTAVVGTRADALAPLQQQDGLWVQRAQAGQGAGRAAAQRSLDQTRAQLDELLTAPGLSVSAVDRLLASATTALATAIDAVAAGDEAAPGRVAAAAARAARLAAPLALAAKRRRPAALAGSPDAAAAELTALAATGFTDHAYAQATADALVVAGAAPGDRLDRATTTLDATTTALGELVTAVEGEDAGARFVKLWRAHTASLTDYARAKTAGDAVGAQTALAELAAFRRDAAELFDEVDAAGKSPALGTALAEHVATSTAAIRAQATRSPLFGPRLLEAADADRALGRVLVARFATQLPGTFPSR